MSHRLRRDHIVSCRALLVAHAADKCEELLEAIEARLESAEMQAARWRVCLVSFESGSAPAERWLVVEHRALADIRHYIRCRGIGAHLEALHIAAIEPPWWKRTAAYVLKRGAWWEMSVPVGGAHEADLRAWLAIVEQAVTAETRQLAQQLGRGRVIGQLEPDTLAWW